jgi:hypothetical protein
MKKFSSKPLFILSITILIAGGYCWYQTQPSDQYWDSQRIKLPDTKQLQQRIDQQLQDRESQLDQQIGVDIDQILDQQAMEAKLSVLTKNVTTTREPSQHELSDFFQQHKEQYRQASQLRFKQLVFAKTKYGGQAVNQAENSLIRTKTDPEYAKYLKQSIETIELSSLQLDEIYGQGYSDKLLKLAQQSLPCWSQPITSIVGAHLLCIEKVRIGTIPTLESVKSQVINHWRHVNAEK